RQCRPGQFVMVRAREGFDPLLRRPMSIARVLPGRGGHIQILYKVVGEGTRYLSQQPKGAVLPTLGPLGNGFRLPRRGTRGVLVAGGIGIAIFPFVVDNLRGARGTPPWLVYGARSRGDLVALDFFGRRRVRTHLATEDGSRGTKGFVTHILEPLLETRDAGPP